MNLGLERLIDPSVEISPLATLGALASELQRGDLQFFRDGDRWHAVVPRLLVGMPSTRRVIDVPTIAVAPLDPQVSPLQALSSLDSACVPSLPVVRDGRLLGRLDRARLLLEAGHALHDDLVLEMTTMRRAAAALVHDLGNALQVAAADADDTAEFEAARRDGLEQAMLLTRRLRHVLQGTRTGARYVELRQLVERQLPLLRSLGHPDTEVIIDAPWPTDDVAVHCDPLLVERALLNLVANARDAARQLDRTTTTRLAIVTRPDTVGIVVLDDGPGISGDRLPRVFERGYTTKPGHSGIGLSALLRAAREHGGDLVVESRIGRYTRFELVLPRTSEERGGDPATRGRT